MSATTYNVVADLLEQCRQPDEPYAPPWPTTDSWCQREYALNPDGLPVEPTDPAACSWCPVGRVQGIAYPPADSGAPAYDENAVNAALSLLNDAMGQTQPADDGRRILHWSDRPGRTLQQIVDAFDTAIAAARSLGDQPIPE